MKNKRETIENNINRINEQILFKRSEIDYVGKHKNKNLRWSIVPSTILIGIALSSLVLCSIIYDFPNPLTGAFWQDTFCIELVKFSLRLPLLISVGFTSVFGIKYFKDKKELKKLKAQEAFLLNEKSKSMTELNELKENELDKNDDKAIDNLSYLSLTQERIYEFFIKHKEKLLKMKESGELYRLSEIGFGNIELFYLNELINGEIYLNQDALTRTRAKNNKKA